MLNQLGAQQLPHTPYANINAKNMAKITRITFENTLITTPGICGVCGLRLTIPMKKLASGAAAICPIQSLSSSPHLGFTGDEGMRLIFRQVPVLCEVCTLVSML